MSCRFPNLAEDGCNFHGQVELPSKMRRRSFSLGDFVTTNPGIARYEPVPRGQPANRTPDLLLTQTHQGKESRTMAWMVMMLFLYVWIEDVGRSISGTPLTVTRFAKDSPMLSQRFWPYAAMKPHDIKPHLYPMGQLSLFKSPWRSSVTS